MSQKITVNKPTAVDICLAVVGREGFTAFQTSVLLLVIRLGYASLDFFHIIGVCVWSEPNR